MFEWKTKAIIAVMKARTYLLETGEKDAGMQIIEVLILLAIGLGLIAVFIGFSDQITAAVAEKVGEFMEIFNA